MLDKSLKFLKLLRNFEKVERAIFRPTDKKENDVEHSYQVAMMAWFLSDQFNISLSKDKLIKYGLVHDLVEVYAGDTPVYGKHENTVETKKEREEKALSRIKEEFSIFKELGEVIDCYEQKKDEESIFIYEVDKILPTLNIYLDGGYGWNKLGLTLEEIKKEKRSKITSVKQLVVLLEEILDRFEKEKDVLFNNKL
ncbi:MAG: HD domain-containing protein [Candidatus Paceibacterota bacterium]|jgi:putative hydrolase of HD superfamily